MHPSVSVYLEHDGKVLLVDEQGIGPQLPQPGRMGNSNTLRFPTVDEVEVMDLEFVEKDTLRITFGSTQFTVLKGYPKMEWPKHWAWKDACIADNHVHPVAREAIYRSLHRLVAKVMIQNDAGEVLMGKVERGHFNGYWTLPGGYLDHNEHPSIGCVRETLEELGLQIVLDDKEPVITQRVFNDEGISFVSLTYRSTWNGDVSELALQTEEISEARWFSVNDAYQQAVSQFDKEALRSLR
ncbi:MAG: NUDIX hydrolase [Candidatus Poseidonia sp.]|nr:NUDIX hydrolase [Poseidonia sp.]